MRRALLGLILLSACGDDDDVRLDGAPAIDGATIDGTTVDGTTLDGAAGDGAAADGTVDSVPTGDATLVALNVSAGALDPAFAPATDMYDLDLLLADTQVSFTPTAADPGASITVDGLAVASGVSSAPIALAPGSRDVVIDVVSGASSQSYTVHVHRGVDALAALVPSFGTLAPSFASATRSYGLGLPLAVSAARLVPTLLIPSRASVTVAGTPVASGTATAQIPLTVGRNDLPVIVIPLTRAAATYDLAVYRGSDALSGIELLDAGAVVPDRLSPAFDPATTAYTASVGFHWSSLQLDVQRIDPAATVTVAGETVAPGALNTPIPLAIGLTSIPVVVTAPGGAQMTYTIDVTRAAALAQEAYVKASNTGAGDGFGGAVALSGDTLVVGAPFEDSSATGVGGNQADNGATDSGAVYVFTRSGTTWSQQAYLKASNSGAGDRFGSSVALSGDTLVVGAPFEDSAATGVDGNQASNAAADSGAAYVFTRSGTTWVQTAYLKASNTEATDDFGVAVSVAGTTIAVGADLEDSPATGVGGAQGNGAGSSGAVYLFTPSGTTWAQTTYLKAPNTDPGDRFGQSLALWHGATDLLVVGAPYESSGSTSNQADNSKSQSGAAYVVSGATWSQVAYLKAANADPVDRFGTAVAIRQGQIAVGAPREDGAGTWTTGDPSSNSASDSGAAYLFNLAGTTWTQTLYLKGLGVDAGDAFGAAVALQGVVACGAAGEDSAATGINGNQLDNSAAGSGAVGGVTYIKASNTEANDAFGGAVGTWGDTFAAGAPGEASNAAGIGGNQADNSAAGAGAVYVLR